MYEDKQPFAFLYCSNNTMFSANQHTCLLSLNYTDSPKFATYTKGVFLTKKGFRESITLFAIRSLPKHTWFNSNNVFIGREDE